MLNVRLRSLAKPTDLDAGTYYRGLVIQPGVKPWFITMPLREWRSIGVDARYKSLDKIARWHGLGGGALLMGGMAGYLAFVATGVIPYVWMFAIMGALVFGAPLGYLFGRRRELESHYVVIRHQDDKGNWRLTPVVPSAIEQLEKTALSGSVLYESLMAPHIKRFAQKLGKSGMEKLEMLALIVTVGAVAGLLWLIYVMNSDPAQIEQVDESGRPFITSPAGERFYKVD